MRVSCRRFGMVMLMSSLAMGVQYADGQDAPPPSSSPSTSIDIQPPVIEHDPQVSPIAPGQSAVLTVKVTDDVKVREVTLFYRSEGDAGFKSARMVSTGDARYSATLSSTDTRPPGLEYFFQAVDDAGNSVWRASKLFPLKLVVDAQTPVTGAQVTPPVEQQPIPELRAEPSKWWWIVGALAAGAVVAAAGGGGGGDGNPTATATPPTGANGSVQITAPTPP